MDSNKIVVGIDFSAESEIAAEQAMDVARRTGAEIVLVHASPTVEIPELARDSGRSTEETYKAYVAVLEKERSSVHERLSDLADRLSGQGPLVSQILVEDFADSGVCKVAEELRAHLIAVGTHGRTGIRWLLMGSTAENIIRQSSIDVLVARRHHVSHGGYRRILVATDFTPLADRALDRAIDLAADGATIDVVHYFGMRAPGGVFGGSPYIPFELEEDVERAARQKGEALLASRRQDRLTMNFTGVLGEPGLNLVHRLEDGRYDLAALGSHGRRGAKRLVFGSVAIKVMKRAPCSVLIGRAAAGD